MHRKPCSSYTRYRKFSAQPMQIFWHSILSAKFAPVSVIMPKDKSTIRQQIKDRLCVAFDPSVGVISVDENKIVTSTVVVGKRRWFDICDSSFNLAAKLVIEISLTMP